jgi:hypothetical protein
MPILIDLVLSTSFMNKYEVKRPLSKKKLSTEKNAFETNKNENRLNISPIYAGLSNLYTTKMKNLNFNTFI